MFRPAPLTEEELLEKHFQTVKNTFAAENKGQPIDAMKMCSAALAISIIYQERGQKHQTRNEFFEAAQSYHLAMIFLEHHKKYAGITHILFWEEKLKNDFALVEKTYKKQKLPSSPILSIR